MSKVLEIIPIEQYLKTSEYEPDADYVDGVIEERFGGEYDHSAWQMAICYWFRTHSKAWNIRVLPELRVRVSETRVRVPDVVVLAGDAPLEKVITHPPLAVFEILSPEDTVSRMLHRLEDYHQMDIPQIWMLDPVKRSWWRFLGGALINDEVTFDQGAIRFEIEDIQTVLDQK